MMVSNIFNHSNAIMKEYDVRPISRFLKTSNFSGGNQQKIILSRELNKDPKVLLVGQTTRCVDIGAIEFIHQRIIDMRNKGAAILLVSVELDEILSLSDRIVIMFDGSLVGEKINESGSNYGNVNIVVKGGIGYGALLSGEVDEGKLSSVEIIDGGQDYTDASLEILPYFANKSLWTFCRTTR